MSEVAFSQRSFNSQLKRYYSLYTGGFLAFVILLGSMVTGWHYLVDGLAGAVGLGGHRAGRRRGLTLRARPLENFDCSEASAIPVVINVAEMKLHLMPVVIPVISSKNKYRARQSRNSLLPCTDQKFKF